MRLSGSYESRNIKETSLFHSPYTSIVRFSTPPEPPINFSHFARGWNVMNTSALSRASESPFVCRMSSFIRIPYPPPTFIPGDTTDFMDHGFFVGNAHVPCFASKNRPCRVSRFRPRILPRKKLEIKGIRDEIAWIASYPRQDDQSNPGLR